MLKDWNRVVITAAHVLPAKDAHSITSIALHAYTKDNTAHTCWVRSFAFVSPFSRSMDMAVLWLDSPIKRLETNLAARIPSTGSRHYIASGYAKESRVQRHLHGAPRGRFIAFDSGSGRHGMSGGPILINANVYGIYLGLVDTGKGKKMDSEKETPARAAVP